MTHVLFVIKSAQEILPFKEFADFKGVKISMANTLHKARSLDHLEDIDAIIADTNLPDGDSLDLLKSSSVSSGTANCPKIFITGEDPSSETITKAKQLGAKDFITKPFTLKNLEKVFDDISQSQADSQHSATDLQILDETQFFKFSNLIGSSKVMQNVYKMIEQVAPTQATVLVTGSSGTGKELVAQAVHEHSQRANKPFVAINCGAISSELIASALFGHEKGSFTGATQSHKGYFEQASGGTLYLDEITETSTDLQVKLLRVLETGKVIPVGGKRQIDVDVRIIASSNRDPELAVQQGVLREDLYYRLNVFPIRLPQLKDREQDIVSLVHYFLNQFNLVEEKNIGISSAAIEILQQLEFKGNVRELKNVIYRAFIMANDTIDVEHIETYAIDSHVVENKDNGFYVTIGTPIRELQEMLIKNTLKKYENDRNQTAIALGLSVEELNKQVSLMNIDS